MSRIIVIFILIFMDKIHDSNEAKPVQTTLHVLDRVHILKYKLIEKLKNRQVGPDPKYVDTPIVDESVDYVFPNRPITPIHSNDPRKKEGFKLSLLRTTPKPKESKVLREAQRVIDFEHHVVIPKKKSKQARTEAVKSEITDLFYRRMHMSNIVSPWLVCTDLLTPYLNGHKTNMSRSKFVTFTDSVVVRLAQLLTEDLTDHTRDDIASILYQISNLNIRLFQWDINAMKLLLNVISPDVVRHSFKTLKHGIKQIFKNWNLSLGTDLAALLKHTTLFRPPCMLITNNEGSTKTSKGVRFTKTKPPKKLCTGSRENRADDGKACVGTWIAK